MPDEQLKKASERYDLIFKVLTKSTGKNKLVKLEIRSIEKYPVRDIVSWWSTQIFNKHETNILSVCKKPPNRYGQVETKAAKLKTKRNWII